jgi:hypothetical protein
VVSRAEGRADRLCASALSTHGVRRSLTDAAAAVAPCGRGEYRSCRGVAAPRSGG